MPTGDFDSVWADVTTGERGSQLLVHAVPNPCLSWVVFSGNDLVSTTELQAIFDPLRGTVMNHEATTEAMENLIRLYRKEGILACPY